MTHRYAIGDKVIFTNDFGVCWGVRTITGLDSRSDRPTYYTTPTDAPWFSIDERNLTPATDTDIAVSESIAKGQRVRQVDVGQVDVGQGDVGEWDYFQRKYGFKPTLEQLGGCA